VGEHCVGFHNGFVDRRVAAHEYLQRPSLGGRNAAAHRGVEDGHAAGPRGCDKFSPDRGAAHRPVIGSPGGYLRLIPAGFRQVVVEGDALPGRVLPGSPPHPQGGQGEGTEEYDDSDDQQVQQALSDHADDAQRDRCDY